MSIAGITSSIPNTMQFDPSRTRNPNFARFYGTHIGPTKNALRDIAPKSDEKEIARVAAHVITEAYKDTAKKIHPKEHTQMAVAAGSLSIVSAASLLLQRQGRPKVKTGLAVAQGLLAAGVLLAWGEVAMRSLRTKRQIENSTSEEFGVFDESEKGCKKTYKAAEGELAYRLREMKRRAALPQMAAG